MVIELFPHKLLVEQYGTHATVVTIWWGIQKGPVEAQDRVVLHGVDHYQDVTLLSVVILELHQMVVGILVEGELVTE